MRKENNRVFASGIYLERVDTVSIAESVTREHHIPKRKQIGTWDVILILGNGILH